MLSDVLQGLVIGALAGASVVGLISTRQTEAALKLVRECHEDSDAQEKSLDIARESFDRVVAFNKTCSRQRERALDIAKTCCGGVELEPQDAGQGGM